MVAGLLVCANLPSLFACGVELRLPKNHFEGVNEFGQLSVWDQIGDIDLGGGKKLGLITNFRSGRERVSPYLGKGWILAPLDCTFVQVEQNKFMMLQPNGTFTYFTRGKESETLLRGEGTWLAEIKNEIITAWASCGGRMVFSKGRLISMDIKGKVVNFVYSGDRISEIRSDGAAILIVQNDPGNEDILRLLYQGKRIDLEKSEKPRVQVIAGQRVIGGIEKSLSKATLPDGSIKEYKYVTTANLQPGIKILNDGEERVMYWDPQSLLISQDGKWNYNIASKEGQKAAIGRHFGNEFEFWHRDTAKGQEISINKDGTKTLKRWFTSGKLAGEPRSFLVTRVEKGSPSNAWDLTPSEISAEKIAKTFAYDDSARLIRIKDDATGQTISFDHRPDGVLVESAFSQGETLSQKYIVKGKIAKISGVLGDILEIKGEK